MCISKPHDRNINLQTIFVRRFSEAIVLSLLLIQYSAEPRAPSRFSPSKQLQLFVLLQPQDASPSQSARCSTSGGTWKHLPTSQSSTLQALGTSQGLPDEVSKGSPVHGHLFCHPHCCSRAGRKVWQPALHSNASNPQRYVCWRWFIRNTDFPEKFCGKMIAHKIAEKCFLADCSPPHSLLCPAAPLQSLLFQSWAPNLLESICTYSSNCSFFAFQPQFLVFNCLEIQKVCITTLPRNNLYYWYFKS